MKKLPSVIVLDIPEDKKVYFASDQHFGIDSVLKTRERESLFVDWLKAIEKDCGALFLLGDLFDFWFEYSTVVPKGYTRLFGALARFTDRGIPVYFFAGNHDMWVGDYFKEELGFEIFTDPRRFEIRGKKFFIGHGDGLGPGDYGFKAMKAVFRNSVARWLFKWGIHPDWATALARYLSHNSRGKYREMDRRFLGEDREWLVLFSKETLSREYYDYFVFGHRHLPLDIALSESSRYVNLGDWLEYFTYGEFSGGDLQLKTYPISPVR